MREWRGFFRALAIGCLGIMLWGEDMAHAWSWDIRLESFVNAESADETEEATMAFPSLKVEAAKWARESSADSLVFRVRQLAERDCPLRLFLKKTDGTLEIVHSEYDPEGDANPAIQVGNGSRYDLDSSDATEAYMIVSYFPFNYGEWAHRYDVSVFPAEFENSHPIVDMISHDAAYGSDDFFLRYALEGHLLRTSGDTLRFKAEYSYACVPACPILPVEFVVKAKTRDGQYMTLRKETVFWSSGTSFRFDVEAGSSLDVGDDEMMKAVVCLGIMSSPDAPSATTTPSTGGGGGCLLGTGFAVPLLLLPLLIMKK